MEPSDFLKNKKDNSDNNRDEKAEFLKSELFFSINKYSEYIVLYNRMQIQGNYAPISAYEKNDGEIVGFLYVIGNDNTYSLSAEDVVNKMEERFEKQLADKEILSYSILYHSQFDNNDNHDVASDNGEYKAISISYNFENIEKGKIGMPYKVEENAVKFLNFFNEFTPQENNAIFGTKVQDGKNYFQEMMEIKAPSFVNEIGINEVV